MVSPLDHKLLRDLWRMKGQAAAIGMVIALGVGMLVMMQGLVTSLNETRTAYYERYRLAGYLPPSPVRRTIWQRGWRRLTGSARSKPVWWGRR